MSDSGQVNVDNDPMMGRVCQSGRVIGQPDSRLGVKEANMYKIINIRTGEQYKPSSRGYTKYLYANEYAANQAIATMPAKYRAAYKAVAA